MKEQGRIITPGGVGRKRMSPLLMNGAPKYSYGRAVPMAGVMDVLFQRPPPGYISQVNIPGMSEAGAMVQGSRSLPTSETNAEMICRGNFAPISLQ